MARHSAAAVIVAAILSGCAATGPQPEAVSYSAGDAIAANTAMQVIDPWMIGTDDPRLRVPADRTRYEPDNGNTGRQERTGGIAEETTDGP